MDSYNDNFDIFNTLEVVELVKKVRNRKESPTTIIRPDYFANNDELDFFTRFRLIKDTALFILEKIEHFLKYPKYLEHI
jgi:hypothetical protein